MDTFTNMTAGEEMPGCSSYCPGPIVWSVTSISSPTPTDRSRPVSVVSRRHTLAEGLEGDPQLVTHNVPMIATAQSVRRTTATSARES